MTELSVDPDRPELRVLLAAPRGFCAGVRRAIDAVREALRVHGAPVYVRHAIVHNDDVVRELEAEGAIFVDELADVPEGGVVLFSAHGVPPSVPAEAGRLGLMAYDAVCPLVAKVHREVERHDRNGRQVILIGHEGHPEVEGTLGRIAEERAHLVDSVAAVQRLPISPEAPSAYAIQTTYSVDDARDIVEALRDRFADIVGPASSDICYATTNRQAAVRDAAAAADSVIIVGASYSSNARRLAEVASALCPRVQLVGSPDEIDWQLVPRAGTVAISAAASTPEESVQAVISALGRRFNLSVDEMDGRAETTVFRPLPIG